MESFNDLLNQVKSHIKKQISDVAFSCWIEVIEPVRMEQDKAILYVKTPFQKDIIIKQYLDKLNEAFLLIIGFNINIIFTTQDDIKEYLTKEDSKISNNKDEYVSNELENGNYEYTFDTFIVGSSNNFAYAACKAIINNNSGYNPLFIYGSSGLGKTHLLSAISHELKKQQPDKYILYISSETFTNELIAAITNQTINKFHNKYRKADVLLIDDIQFIAGKERTQEEFFHTFNELYQVGKQIVLTSDRPPKDIKTLEDRLKSRFEWGLLTDISPPDFETRIAIINRKAALLNFEISSDVSEFIANKLKTNIRQLEGVVKKIKANKLLLGTQTNISSAQTAIKEILSDHEPTTVTIEKIIEEVAKTYSVSSEDIRSAKRSANVSIARQVSIYIIREVTDMSMANIGEEFSGRDHSTIVYTLNQIKKQMETDSKLQGIVDDIIKNIKNK